MSSYNCRRSTSGDCIGIKVEFQLITWHYQYHLHFCLHLQLNLEDTFTKYPQSENSQSETQVLYRSGL